VVVVAVARGREGRVEPLPARGGADELDVGAGGGDGDGAGGRGLRRRGEEVEVK